MSEPMMPGRSSNDAVLRRMIADREARIGRMQERIDALEHSVYQKDQRIAALDRLVRDLVWADGPRALRAVLPLARLLRRIMSR